MSKARTIFCAACLVSPTKTMKSCPACVKMWRASVSRAHYEANKAVYLLRRRLWRARRRVNPDKRCLKPGCSRPFKARGRCVYHYAKDRRSGRMKPKERRPSVVRVRRKDQRAFYKLRKRYGEGWMIAHLNNELRKALLK